MAMFGTIALTGYHLYVIIPKGLLLQQGNRNYHRPARGRGWQDISDQATTSGSRRSIHAILRDPAVASIGSQIGAGGGTTTVNNGRVFIALKPQNQRVPVDQVIGRLDSNLANIEGITLYMQAAQDITIGGASNSISIYLGRRRPGRAQPLGPLFLDKIRAIPGIVDVTTDQLNAGPNSTSPSSATSPRALASSPRPSTTRSTTRSASASCRPCSPRSTSITSCWRSSRSSNTAPKRSTASTSRHRAVSRCPWPPWSTASPKCRRWSSTTRASSLGDDLVHLKPGTAIGQAVAAIQQVEKQLGRPLSLQTSFQGNAQAFTASSLSSTPILIAAALVCHLPDPRRALREPDRSAHDHFDSAIGRPWRAAAAHGGVTT